MTEREMSWKDVADRLKFKKAMKKQMKYKYVLDKDDVQSLTFFVSDIEDDIEIVTDIDGVEETRNVMQYGDILMVGPKGEQYVISFPEFIKSYNIIDGYAIPRKIEREVAYISEKQFEDIFGIVDEVKFIAPWGEEMILEPGDYLVKDAEGYYRIEGDIFEDTYVFVGNKQNQSPQQRKSPGSKRKVIIDN